MSLMSRLRELFGGGRRGIAGFAPAPGPFDAPPEEPVNLDENDLPWELREPD